MESLELIRAMYGEDPDEQGSASSSSPTMESSQPCQVHVGQSPPIDAIQSIREMYQKIDPLDQIDPLLTFVETQLHRMNNPSEAGSSSSEGWLETVREGTKLAAKTMDTISTEAEQLSISDAVEAMESVTLELVEGTGELHSVFIGLSMAAFAVESYTRVSSVENECTKLLLKILELSQNVNQYREQMQKRGKLCNAVGTIVEGAVICCDYLSRVRIFRFWSATTAAAQLLKTNQQLSDIRDCFGVSSLQQVQQLLDFQWKKYYGGDRDVFLSHSGKQKNFVRQLHKDLTSEDVSCFLDEDDECLPLAQKFPDLIFEHARTCKIAVLLLSKEFIGSKWPMLELSAFINAMNSGKNANLSEGENEVVFREKVVEKICCLLKQINPESHVQLLDFMPVGIEEAQNKVIDLLDLRDESPRIVVIYGIGGIGKTTLATVVVSSLDLTGYHYCRVDMDQDCRLSDLQAMQEQILRDLFGKKLKLSNCTEGLKKLREAIGKASKPVFLGKASKPVFLFVDNALKKNDLEMLLPIEQLSNLPKQSRILLTTRNLNESKMVGLQDGIRVYSHRVDSVSVTEAKRMLCHYALGDTNASFDRRVNMYGLLEFCGGIPLVLRIVGCHLRRDGNNVSASNEILEYHKKWQQEEFEGGEEDISERIVDFVYRRLKKHCKEAFLDIAFFFYNWKRNVVAEIVGEMELRDLEGAAFVTTSGGVDGWVRVHDIVRALGRKLSEGNRINDCEYLDDLLVDKQKLQQIKGLWLSDDSNKFSLEAEQVDFMSRSLRVLFLAYPMRLNGRCKRAFKDLRVLHICFEDMLPIDLSKSTQLVNFHGYFTEGHEISEAKLIINIPYSLRCLSLWCKDFSNSPISLDLYGKATSLRDLRISNFSLVNLETDIWNLSSLQTLVMNGCNSLCSLPDNFVGLKCLKFLDISGCGKLKKLPQDILCSTSLAIIKASGCTELEASVMDSLVEINSLLFLEMGESPMLIKGWEEIRQHRPLIGAALNFPYGNYPYREILSTLFFNGASRFLHLNGEGQLAEVAAFAEEETDIDMALLLTSSDLSNRAREKLVELASEEFQIMYVDVGVEEEEEEEREKRIKETLKQLPEGGRAWTSSFHKTTLLFAYSLWRYTGRVDTSIVHTMVLVDEEDRSELYPDKQLFGSDISDSRRVDLTRLLSPLDEAWDCQYIFY